MKNNLIKQDINFLEYPLYLLHKRVLKKDINMKFGDKHFQMSVGYKTPNTIDMLFLYYFLKELERKNYSKKIILKKSKVVKAIDPNMNSYYYKRLNETLKVWRNIGLSFEGNFYDGKKYLTLLFGIMDNAYITDEGKVLIDFNENFIEIIKNTNFYRYINFDEIKKLKRPISLRLYEILKKSSLPLKIEIKKLALKIPINEKYPSKIIEKLNPAIKEINKNTNLKIESEYYKNEFDETIFVVKKRGILSDYNDLTKKEMKIFDKLSEFKINGPVIIDFIKTYPAERLKEVYKYTIEQEPENEAGFFVMALKENYTILNLEQREILRRNRNLQKEAVKKYRTVCGYGNCWASWKEYENRENTICYWCPKFEKQRNKKLNNK